MCICTRKRERSAALTYSNKRKAPLFEKNAKRGAANAAWSCFLYACMRLYLNPTACVGAAPCMRPRVNCMRPCGGIHTRKRMHLYLNGCSPVF